MPGVLAETADQGKAVARFRKCSGRSCSRSPKSPRLQLLKSIF